MNRCGIDPPSLWDGKDWWCATRHCLSNFRCAFGTSLATAHGNGLATLMATLFSEKLWLKLLSRRPGRYGGQCHRAKQAGICHRPVSHVKRFVIHVHHIYVLENFPRHPAPVQITDAVGRNIRDLDFQLIAGRFQVVRDHVERRRDEREVILAVQPHPRALAAIELLSGSKT